MPWTADPWVDIPPLAYHSGSGPALRWVLACGLWEPKSAGAGPGGAVAHPKGLHSHRIESQAVLRRDRRLDILDGECNAAALLPQGETVPKFGWNSSSFRFISSTIHLPVTVLYAGACPPIKTLRNIAGTSSLPSCVLSRLVSAIVLWPAGTTDVIVPASAVIPTVSLGASPRIALSVATSRADSGASTSAWPATKYTKDSASAPSSAGTWEGFPWPKDIDVLKSVLEIKRKSRTPRAFYIVRWTARGTSMLR